MKLESNCFQKLIEKMEDYCKNQTKKMNQFIYKGKEIKFSYREISNGNFEILFYHYVNDHYPSWVPFEKVQFDLKTRTIDPGTLFGINFEGSFEAIRSDLMKGRFLLKPLIVVEEQNEMELSEEIRSDFNIALLLVYKIYSEFGDLVEYKTISWDAKSGLYRIPCISSQQEYKVLNVLNNLHHIIDGFIDKISNKHISESEMLILTDYIETYNAVQKYIDTYKDFLRTRIRFDEVFFIAMGYRDKLKHDIAIYKSWGCSEKMVYEMLTGYREFS